MFSRFTFYATSRQSARYYSSNSEIRQVLWHPPEPKAVEYSSPLLKRVLAQDVVDARHLVESILETQKVHGETNQTMVISPKKAFNHSDIENESKNKNSDTDTSISFRS